MLLIMILQPTHIAVELVLHVWYSARLTSGMVQSLRESIQPAIADVVGRIADRLDGKIHVGGWGLRTCIMTAHLYKDQWRFVLAMLEKCHNLDETENSRRDIMLNDTRLDNRERILFALPPSRRVCTSKMRQDSILLPFRSYLEEFKFPNP